MKRSYQQSSRAQTQERTRQKIISATMQLHQEKGLLATSVSDIAQRAKVGKVTVYRHFPSDTELVQACSGQYFHLNPFPDLEKWSTIKDPRKRISKALKETHQFHKTTAPMMSGILAEARNHPVVQPYHDFWKAAVEILAADRNKIFKAKVGLALSFDGWYLLTHQNGLNDDETLQIMLDILK